MLSYNTAFSRSETPPGFKPGIPGGIWEGALLLAMDKSLLLLLLQVSLFRKPLSGCTLPPAEGGTLPGFMAIQTFEQMMQNTDKIWVPRQCNCISPISRGISHCRSPLFPKLWIRVAHQSVESGVRDSPESDKKYPSIKCLTNSAKLLSWKIDRICTKKPLQKKIKPTHLHSYFSCNHLTG